MTMREASCQVWSVAQFDSLGMAWSPELKNARTLPPKAFGTNYGKPATVLDRK
jgi:hypothetical protein